MPNADTGGGWPGWRCWPQRHFLRRIAGRLGGPAAGAGAAARCSAAGDEFSRMIMQSVRLPRAVAAFAVGEPAGAGRRAVAGAVPQSAGRPAGARGVGRRGDRRPRRHAGAAWASRPCTGMRPPAACRSWLRRAAAGARRRCDPPAAVWRGAGQRLRRRDHACC